MDKELIKQLIPEVKQLIAEAAKEVFAQSSKKLEDKLEKEAKAHNERLENEKKARNIEIENEMKAYNERLENERKARNEEIKNEKKERREQIKAELKAHNIQIKKQIKAFNQQMKELSLQIGGIGNSNGSNAEEFFYRSLEKTMAIADISFDFINVNVNRYTKNANLKGQYDIVLNNCDTTLVVEVKYKLTPNYVEDFYHRSLPKFKQLFPEFAKHKIYGAVASFSDFDNARQLAANYGLFVLGQAGQSLKVLNKNACQL
jgi:hypothetical protein